MFVVGLIIGAGLFKSVFDCVVLSKDATLEKAVNEPIVKIVIKK